MRLTEPVVVPLPGSMKPWDCFTRLAHLPYVLFLDSASQHPELGRYSYLTADPFEVYVARGPSEVRATLAKLKEQWLHWRKPSDPKLPPFQGGLAGLWGYGIHRALEQIPETTWNDFDTPDLVLGWYDWVIAFDHIKNEAVLISQGFPESQACEQSDQAEIRADRILKLLKREPVEKRAASSILSRENLAPSYPLPGHSGVMSNFTPNGFRHAIQRGINYTHAGDCFQVNLAQRLLVPFHESPIKLYERLRQQSPAQCAGYFDLGDYVVASSSPERFIQIDAAGNMETRPIKGTRPRGNNIDEDQHLIRELEKSAKDRAENVMIVDLLRNDLGRVAEFGSITVLEICKIESNASVHHLVSVVKAQIRQGLTPLDVLQATLPGGSVTGAPKVRAMEIIAELEPTARGAYCGCLGYVSFSGAMDTNILIRTFTLGRGWAQFPVGGGIVADSNPDAEYAETLDKARGMLAALA
ncbi:MAG: aminodeoxychorismate synthase component I [Gemmatales bacterium]